MKTFDDLPIRIKIPLSFVLMLTIVILLGLLSINRLNAIEDDAEAIRNNFLPSTGQMSKLYIAIYNYRVREGRYLVVAADGTEPLIEAQADIDKASAEIATARKDYEPLIIRGSEDEALIRRFDQEWVRYVPVSQKMLSLAAAHDLKSATKLYGGESKDQFGLARAALIKDSELKQRESKDAADRGAGIGRTTKFLVYGALAVASLLSAILGWLLVSGVSTPIQRLTAAMARLAQHDLTIVISGIGRKDEIGAMAGAVEVFKDSMGEADRLAALGYSDRLPAIDGIPTASDDGSFPRTLSSTS